jgi:hypothetical protein
MAATRTAEARWRALVREQETSGSSVRAFAEARGVSAAVTVDLDGQRYRLRTDIGRQRREAFASASLGHPCAITSFGPHLLRK